MPAVYLVSLPSALRRQTKTLGVKLIGFLSISGSSCQLLPDELIKVTAELINLPLAVFRYVLFWREK